MVLIVRARAPSREATWCLSTSVVARLTPEKESRRLCAPASQRVCLLHRSTGRFITPRSSAPLPPDLIPEIRVASRENLVPWTRVHPAPRKPITGSANLFVDAEERQVHRDHDESDHAADE